LRDSTLDSYRQFRAARPRRCNAGESCRRPILGAPADRSKRLLATEVLVCNTAARTNIRDQAFHQLASVMQMGRREGMHTMDSQLLTLYEAGEITYDTALTHANDAKHFRALVEKGRQDSSSVEA